MELPQILLPAVLAFLAGVNMYAVYSSEPNIVRAVGGMFGVVLRYCLIVVLVYWGGFWN